MVPKKLYRNTLKGSDFLEANVEEVRNLVREKTKLINRSQRYFQKLFLRLGEVFPNGTFDCFVLLTGAQVDDIDDMIRLHNAGSFTLFTDRQ